MKKNSLIFGTNNVETPFLNEAELPECARLNRKRTLASTEQGSSGGTSLQDEEDRQLAEALAKSQAESGGGS